MIIWLNGAFGAGKTQTAFELHRRLPGSYLYDPEEAGYFIRRNLPKAVLKSDFQDYPMWRTFNVEMLDYICTHYSGDVIVPMTITDRGYYDELVGVLAKHYELRHFILYAGRETLSKRLALRFEGKRSWAAQQIDRCICAFDHDITQTKIVTDQLSIRQVTEQVAAEAGLCLLEDRRGRFRSFVDRTVQKCKKIR